MKDPQSRARATVRRVLAKHRDLVLEELLNNPVWPMGVEQDVEYRRFSDDNKSFLGVAFSVDSDAWTTVFSEPDPREPSSFSQRFRTGFGGGQSLRVRAALLILAKAIMLDNESRPQRPRP